MRKWLLLVLGTVIAFGFHAEVSAQTTMLDFALAFALAGALFLYGAPAPVAAPSNILYKPLNLRRYLWVAAGCTLLALLAVAGATWFLYQRLSDPLGLALWGSAALFLLVGWWQPGAYQLERQEDKEAKSLPSARWTWYLLFGIVFLALVLRLWKLEIYPYGLQSDESNNARDALQWLAGAPYSPYSEANRGQATLFTYLIALSFKFFGVNVLAMRYVAVFVGTVTVLSFYVLARSLLSAPAALLSTAFLAVSRWHITFSRIIYELILTPLALIWLFYFLYRGLRERTPRYFVLAGFALAFGFNTYTAFRVAPLGVALLVLFWLVADWRHVWGNLARLLLFTLSALVGLTPLFIYALQKPEVILWRIRELSILDEMANAGTWQPLWHNLRSYAAMFNLVGDHSPLNNLPDAPMVSWVAGTLFVLGLLYAIRYWRHLPLFLLLAWSMAVLPAGILSVTVETPSARRVIGLAPLLFLLAGVAADVLRRAMATTWHKQLQLVWPLGAALSFALFAFAELQTFAIQASDMNVRRAFNISEWSVGSYMATIDPATTQILLDRSYVGNNIIAFASANKPYTPLDEVNDIPFLPAFQAKVEGSYERDLLYLLRPGQGQLRLLLEYFYPQGQWEEHVDPQGLLLFNTFTLPLSAQQGLQGLLARYYTYPTADQKAPPTLLAERVEATVGEPAPVAPPYRVAWSGSLLVQHHGQYEFTVETTYPFTLTVADQVSVTQSTTVTLYAGLHALRLTVEVTSTTATGDSGRAEPAPALQWRGPLPQAPNANASPNTALLTVSPPTFGLIGTYYPNNRWEGAPTVVRHDFVVAPNETLPSPYSVIWRGNLGVPADGLYTLGLNADDGALLYVDEQLIVDNGGLHGARYVENSVQLTRGLHDVAIHYVQDGGAQALDIQWAGPNRGRGPLPIEQLLPYPVDVARLVATAAPATSTTLATPTLAAAAGQATVIQEADGPFAQPRGIAVGKEGQIYVADTGNRRLVGLAADGTVLFTQRMGAEPFREPFDLGVDATGQIYVLDPATARIELFTSDGAYLRQFNAAPDLVERARGLFVEAQGQVWIAHTPGARVVQLRANGELVRTIPIPGQPIDVAVDSDGLIYVTDVEQHRLLRLDQNGQIMAEYTIPTANGIDGPHLAVDQQNALYITEPEPAAILKLSADGQVLFHQKLPAPLGMLVKPIGIAVDAQGQLWTTDAQGGSVWRLNPAQ